MQILIQVVAFANGVRCPHAGQFVKSFDFEAHDGRGYGEFTHDPHAAMKFDDAVGALEFWRTISKTVPTRLDGKPNRPLTSCTVRMFRIGVDDPKLPDAIVQIADVVASSKR